MRRLPPHLVPFSTDHFCQIPQKTKRNSSIADTPKLPGNTPPSSPVRNSGDGESRAIREVIDLSRPAGRQRREVGAVLNPLTEPMLRDLRRDVAGGNADGNSRFLCGSCGAPATLCSSPASATVPRDGRAAHFRHPVGAGPCAWRTPHDPHVAAKKYASNEGPEHAFLKAQLVDCLSRDPRFSNIRVERQVPILGGTRLQPDVSATFLGQPVAFDIQLSTAGLKVVMDREKGYRGAGYQHVWLSRPELDRLTQACFGDIHSGVGGRIFVIDPGSVAATMRAGQLQLREISLTPRLAKGKAVHSIWTSAMVGRAMRNDPPNSARLSRAQQKQLSRDRDVMLLQSGQITEAELKRRNSFFWRTAHQAV